MQTRCSILSFTHGKTARYRAQSYGPCEEQVAEKGFVSQRRQLYRYSLKMPIIWAKFMWRKQNEGIKYETNMILSKKPPVNEGGVEVSN